MEDSSKCSTAKLLDLPTGEKSRITLNPDGEYVYIQKGIFKSTTTKVRMQWYDDRMRVQDIVLVRSDVCRSYLQAAGTTIDLKTGFLNVISKPRDPPRIAAAEKASKEAAKWERPSRGAPLGSFSSSAFDHSRKIHRTIGEILLEHKREQTFNRDFPPGQNLRQRSHPQLRPTIVTQQRRPSA